MAEAQRAAASLEITDRSAKDPVFAQFSSREVQLKHAEVNGFEAAVLRGFFGR